MQCISEPCLGSDLINRFFTQSSKQKGQNSSQLYVPVYLMGHSMGFFFLYFPISLTPHTPSSTFSDDVLNNTASMLTSNQPVYQKVKSGLTVKEAIDIYSLQFCLLLSPIQSLSLIFIMLGKGI
jgi:hypothetical protein